MFSATHQMKLVVKPPRRTTTSLGSPVQMVGVPAAADRTEIGAPASSPYAKQELMIPENTATIIPLGKLKSRIAAFLPASDISRSLDNPARAAIAMPRRHTPTPV